MGWPRLVPVKDQQPQKPTHNEPSQIHRSSASPSLQDPNEQAIPPTAVEKPTPEDRPLSPVHSAAGSAHSTEEFGTALIERPNPLENTDTVPAMEYSDAPESSKMASERLPVEVCNKSTQAQRTPSPLSAVASAIQGTQPERWFSLTIGPPTITSRRRSASTRRAICSS